MTTSPPHSQVERRLGDHGVRYTPGRRTVVVALAGSGGPRSAAELHAELEGRLPLSSLYRSLSVLEEAGVISSHHTSKGLTRYELAEWLRGHHHHLVCIDCGRVEDIDIPDTYEDQVRALVAGIGTMVSFVPTDHALEIQGRCARCA